MTDGATAPSQNGSSAKRRTWVFQANPERYRINDSLRIEDDEYWNLNQHASKVQPGDRVLIWISGKSAGIYAIGTIMTDPVTMPDSQQGQRYWTNQSDGLKVKPRVLVHYTQRFIQRPLLKVYLETDPELKDMRIIRSPRGTNFPVTDAEWNAIQEWLTSGTP